MEMTDIIQGGGLVLSGAAVTKLVSIAVKAWAARNGKTEVPAARRQCRRRL